MKILCATSNKDKLVEYQKELDIPGIQLILPASRLDVVEDGDTLMENARIKGLAFFNQFSLPVLADDTGLFVEELAGLPGVHSARYSYTGTYEANVDKLLRKLSGKRNRNAYFETVIYYRPDEEREYFFSGKCHGKILQKRTTDEGFGYDPIFRPSGHDLSFSELSIEEKNRISHRGLAVAKLKKFILSQSDLID